MGTFSGKALLVMSCLASDSSNLHLTVWNHGLCCKLYINLEHISYHQQLWEARVITMSHLTASPLGWHMKAYSSLQRALATPRPSCRLQTLAWLLCILALLTACRGLTWSKAQENPCSESTLKWCYTILHTWNCTRFPAAFHADLSISISFYIHTNHISPEARRDSDQHSLQIHFSRDSSASSHSSPWHLTTCRCQWHLDLADLARNAPGSGATRWCAHRRALGAASWGGGTTCVRENRRAWGGWTPTTFWSLNWCWNVSK